VTLRVFLVDDEAPARDRLRRLLEEIDEVRVIGEAEDGDAAVEAIGRLRPDAIFLDIQMPGRSGLEVLSALPPPRPRVIFCTAFDRYALEAFERHALDYLLKPVRRDRLASALDRLRREMDGEGELLREITAAGETQSRFFPRAVAADKGIDLAGVCRAARGVGGDYYDFLDAGERKVGIALGDVAGKGLPSALLMAGLQGRLRSLAPVHGASLPGLFEALNRSLLDVTESARYATLFYGVLDIESRVLRYVNAGQVPPLLIRPDAAGAEGAALPLGPGAAPVGLLREAVFAEARVQVGTGDLLLLFSDGLPETRNPEGVEFGTAPIERIARGCAADPAARIRDRILEDADRFRGRETPEDDVTLVVAKIP
jgi:serine phosphatase RsbU (regulator of sigma subunit)